VLLPLAVALSLTVIGTLVVVKVAHITLRRLGLELASVLVWFGLADAPAIYLARRR
jgi:hypothetical protein